MGRAIVRPRWSTERHKAMLSCRSRGRRPRRRPPNRVQSLSTRGQEVRGSCQHVEAWALIMGM